MGTCGKFLHLEISFSLESVCVLRYIFSSLREHSASERALEDSIERTALNGELYLASRPT